MNNHNENNPRASAPLNALRHHVTGAIERGEAKPIEAITENVEDSELTRLQENERRIQDETDEGKAPCVISRKEYDRLTIARVSDDFDPSRDFESVQDAIDYCNEQQSPIFAMGAIVAANMAKGEFGFAGDLVHEGNKLKA